MKGGNLDPETRRDACESYHRAARRIMVSVCEALEANPEALRYMDSITFT
jgi:hypothetical protein